MNTHFLLTSNAFQPTPGELDEEHDDFINPGMYALELGNFLASALAEHGYPTRSQCQEDWGHWLELEHSGQFTLAVCCANTGDMIGGQAEHRVFLSPDKPIIRRWFKKIDIQRDLLALAATLEDIFEESPEIQNVRYEDEL